VGLTQAAGVANRLGAPEQTRGAGFWQRLGEFLSPKVLGYAIPALVLTVVIGIGFVALKQRERSQLVAQNERPGEAPSVAQTNADSAPSSAARPQATVQNGIQSGTTTELPREKSTLEDEKLQAGQGLLKPDSNVAKVAPSKDAAGQPADVGSVAESRPYAPEPKSAEPPPPAPVINSEKSAELAKERSEKREDQPRDQDEGVRVQTDDVHGPNRSRSNTAQPMSQRGAGGIMAGRGPSADKNKKGADVETRSVMGRHFTREGDAWVDTAYEYSQATVRVARGSDQFRALVADEPAIRTIAAQLNGVVIVVWKNRAYRIQ
jgi:hypothetical protein